MRFLTLLVVIAMLATIGTLVMGLWSMVFQSEGQTGRLDSEHWMFYRLFLQGIALLALVATFFVSSA
jgi:hypothetical protein